MPENDNWNSACYTQLGEKKKKVWEILKYVPWILKFLGPNFTPVKTERKIADKNDRNLCEK